MVRLSAAGWDVVAACGGTGPGLGGGAGADYYDAFTQN